MRTGSVNPTTSRFDQPCTDRAETSTRRSRARPCTRSRRPCAPAARIGEPSGAATRQGGRRLTGVATPVLSQTQVRRSWGATWPTNLREPTVPGGCVPSGTGCGTRSGRLVTGTGVGMRPCSRQGRIRAAPGRIRPFHGIRMRPRRRRRVPPTHSRPAGRTVRIPCMSHRAGPSTPIPGVPYRRRRGPARRLPAEVSQSRPLDSYRQTPSQSGIAAGAQTATIRPSPPQRHREQLAGPSSQQRATTPGRSAPPPALGG